MGGAAPALAAPPFPAGGQATALVSGTPLIQATCTTTPTLSGGNSSLGLVRVGNPAGARCASTGTSADGVYSLDGSVPTTLRFSAQCINSVGLTNGIVDVPAGTTVPGLGVVTAQTTVTANVTVIYPGGAMAILNSVTTTATSVTRTAIQITSGPSAGTVIGRAVCGTPVPYPLAVDAPGAGAAAPDLALATVSGSSSGSSSNRMLYIGGAFALLILAQVAVGRNMWRRRRGVTGS